MRFPKIQLKTEFWGETKLYDWRERYLNLTHSLAIFGILNILLSFFNLGTGTVWGLNLIPILGSILAIRSKASWNKKVYVNGRNEKD